ncbi:MAG: coiled-coil domain-containing protein 22 [Planctomycetes bacterium]|nr:coiled-coil domain-containing protein 22 [Planctomycetota bacterium]
MKNLIFSALLTCLFIVSLGCFQLKVEEPLVDFSPNASYSSPSVEDPAPGVPDSQLTREQQLQRELHRCQQLLQQSENDKNRYRREIRDLKNETDQLEEDIEDLQDKNEKLQKELNKIRR